MARQKVQTVEVKAPAEAKKRSRLSQEDVPSYSLEQALRVPRAIAENYAHKPTRPLHVAGAMKMTPTSGAFRTITGAAVAYGLTAGAAQAPEISLTPLGMRAVRPTAVGDDLAAKREALLRPKVIGDFLRRYDGSALPPDDIAKNVLHELGVPADRVADVFDTIAQGASSVGFISDMNGKPYVDLAGPHATPTVSVATDITEPEQEGSFPAARNVPATRTPPVAVSVGQGIHINIEIHIAADASSETIENIFRNMRRYVLNGDGNPETDGPATGK